MTVLATPGLAPRLGRSRRPLAAFGAALVCAVGVAAVYAVFVLLPEGRAIDHRAMLSVMGRAEPYRSLADSVLETVTVPAAIGAVLVALLIALLRGRPMLGFLAGGTVLAANVTTQLLKATLDRPAFAEGAANSLPSGHVTAALSIVVALVLVSPLWLKPFVAVVGVGYAVTVGIATIAAGWHRPSDVLAAGLVVLVWAFLALGLAGNRRPGRRAVRPAG